ncbi:hypothetical protein BD414DRAFT_475647 [Trametes punicea]|nr:hypothetical protein BD414DRAFT_475647 [Trametes punicea]
MGSSGNDSRNDESQASQLLAAALQPREPQAADSYTTFRGEPQVVVGSFPTSDSNSVHYHLNGLMPTQTQSLYSIQNISCEEGSQKENAPTSLEKARDSPHASPREGSPPGAQSGPSCPSPPTDHLPPSKGPKEKACPKEHRVVLTSPSGKGTKAVGFVSPPRPTSHVRTNVDRVAILDAVKSMPPPPRPRSQSPASQDSFAGPLPEQDPAKAFIEQAKVFQIPLSQLGEDSQSVSEEDGPPPLPSTMWASRANVRSAPSSPPHGKVLVEGTPSTSSRSNDARSQSQTRFSHSHDESQRSSDDTQLSDLFPPGQGLSIEAEMAGLVEGRPTDTHHEDEHGHENGTHPSQGSQSDASTEPSSSYERLANQDPFAPLLEATQPAHDPADEAHPVNYSGPTHVSDAQSVLREHDFWNENGQIVFPSVPSESRSSNTTRSTIPRGLLGLVAPHKRYRYQDIIMGANATAGPSTARATVDSTVRYDDMDETQPPDVSLSVNSARVKETQPSDLSAPNESAASVPLRRTLPTATRALQDLRAHRRSSTTEIVPDSEEIRIVPDSDPPPASLPANPPTAQSTPSKPKSRQGLQSEDEVLRTVALESTSLSVDPIREEEEEEEEEEEVPLAVAVHSARANGKQKVMAPPAPTSTGLAPVSPIKESPVSTKKTGPAALARDKVPTYTSNSWRDAVVPSSDPQERREDILAQQRSTKPVTPVEQIAPSLARTRSAPRQAKLAARERLQESSSDEDEGVVIPDQEDDDKDTQPAEDEMDVDLPEAPAKPRRNSKRKRTVSSSARKNSIKTPKEESRTPASRPTKRLKSASNARGASGTATRVFALWKQDGHYYSGTVHSLVSTGRYDIRFDDGDSAHVELKHMRACRLREGDNVLLQGKAKAVVVRAPSCGPSGHQAEDTVTVDLDEDGEETAQVQTLRLATRTVSSEWGDRMLAEDIVSPVVKPKLSRASPTPSRLSVPSEGSVRGGRKPLNKTGLVITLSPNRDGEKERETLMADIRRNGGVVLDDWTSLFAMDGTIAQKGHRWCLKADDIQWRDRSDVDRAFLISDEHTHKPKFLMALALGIPCLSVDWLRSIVREQTDMDWQPYLLPAGFSEHLNTRISQLVDLDWGNCKQHLKEITKNLVPSKVFTGKSILCVSQQFVPCRQKGKKNGGGGSQGPESVPQIILCMGADTVEAVTEEKHASLDIEQYDYVVVREEQDYERLRRLERCVGVNWVKDCLISGRLLPLPTNTC